MKAAKSKRSNLESAFRNTKSTETEALYKAHCLKYKKLLTASKRSYYRTLISSNQNSPKKMWQAVNSLLGRNLPKILPNAESASVLATSFLNFFNDKIVKLCTSIPLNIHNPLPDDSCFNAPPVLSEFEPATVDEILNLISISNDSTCSLDVIPTKLLKSCANALSYPITRLINLSLSDGSFPNDLKHAIVNPLLKKSSLPKDQLSSYRPISNLNFISKLLERVIYSRMCKHLESFPSLSCFQSAYRKFHSTETALLRIHNDLNLAMERSQVSALILLDLSAAFDTVDHTILLSRLSSSFGITNSALSVFSSYLSNRSQTVLIDQSQSHKLPLLLGVPQGSVLGPLLFTLYTTPLSHLLSSMSMNFHFYADDTQIYISFSNTDTDQALRKLTGALDSIFSWFCANRLAVNPSKTEYLLIGTSKQRSMILNSSIHFQNNALIPSKSARNLGVIFDSELNFKDHISSVCRSSFFQIRQLRQIRSSLDMNSAIILANALVHSKIDYCNSLFYGVPSSSIVRLQYVQNSLARVVCNASKFQSHSSTLLRKLHWLPIPERIQYKIALLTFKTLKFGLPSYLSDLLTLYHPGRTLRSSNLNLLSVPDIRSKIGRRSFSFSAPMVWNSLPCELRSLTCLASFRSRLKTHLFPP